MFGETYPNLGVTAWEACCHCDGGESATPPACELVPYWVDDFGASCAYFEWIEPIGCPFEGKVTGNDGFTANEACCRFAAAESSADFNVETNDTGPNGCMLILSGCRRFSTIRNGYRWIHSLGSVLCL